ITLYSGSPSSYFSIYFLAGQYPLIPLHIKAPPVTKAKSERRGCEAIFLIPKVSNIPPLNIERTRSEAPILFFTSFIKEQLSFIFSIMLISYFFLCVVKLFSICYYNQNAC